MSVPAISLCYTACWANIIGHQLMGTRGAQTEFENIWDSFSRCMSLFIYLLLCCLEYNPLMCEETHSWWWGRVELCGVWPGPVSQSVDSGQRVSRGEESVMSHWAATSDHNNHCLTTLIFCFRFNSIIKVKNFSERKGTHDKAKDQKSFCSVRL